MPSASSTTGTDAEPNTLDTADRTVPDRPSPGPIAMAWHRDAASRSGPSQSAAGNGRPTASPGGSAESAAPGTPRRTYPAPALMAARLSSDGAPIMPGDPATTATAVCHLCA